MDAIFDDERLYKFLMPTQGRDYLMDLLTIHMTDQKLYSKYDFDIKAKVGIRSSEPSEKY